MEELQCNRLEKSLLVSKVMFLLKNLKRRILSVLSQNSYGGGCAFERQFYLAIEFATFADFLTAEWGKSYLQCHFLQDLSE